MPDSSGAEKAFHEMLQSFGEAGDMVIDAAASPLEAVEGQRMLTRIMGAAFELQVENADTEHPSFSRVMTEHRKFYGDSPDAYYDYAPLDGRRAYRVRGVKGNSLYFAFCIYGGSFTGGTNVVGNVSDDALEIADDGSFEVVLSAERPDGARNWLPITEDTFCVVVRQYFADRPQDRGAREVLDLEIALRSDKSGVGPPPPLDDSPFADRLRQAGEFVSHGLRLTNFVGAALSSMPNQVTINIDSADAAAALFPTPDNRYVGGWYEIGPDEALVIEGRPVPARYWSVQLLNRWFESFDYENHQCSLNMNTTRLEPDGSYRFVVAHREPGVPNWLDTAGHETGIVGFRWMQCDADVPSPTFTVVPVEALTG